jgi:hypothetical protein
MSIAAESFILEESKLNEMFSLKVSYSFEGLKEIIARLAAGLAHQQKQITDINYQLGKNTLAQMLAEFNITEQSGAKILEIERVLSKHKDKLQAQRDDFDQMHEETGDTLNTHSLSIQGTNHSYHSQP